MMRKSLDEGRQAQAWPRCFYGGTLREKAAAFWGASCCAARDGMLHREHCEENRSSWSF